MFPFYLPSATAFYETLYVLTFALHVLFMMYVVGGSLYVAVTITRVRGSYHTHSALADVVRDWLPFMAGAAITAGVAPLLFLQIVHYQAFYTANALLSWRWMVLIPVLITAFYLLYASKIPRGIQPLWRLVIVWAAVACFLFAGFCWSANHLLSTAESSWPEVYRSGRMPFATITILGRMAVWISGALPTMCLIAGWQLRDRRQLSASDERDEIDRGVTSTARLALMGLAAMLVAIGIALAGSPPLRAAFSSTAGWPYAAAGGIGIALQATGWWKLFRGNDWLRGPLLLASAGTALLLVSGSVLRELARLQDTDLSRLVDDHAASAQVGGWTLFLLFAVLNAAWIAGCIVLVRRHIVRAAANDAEAG